MIIQILTSQLETANATNVQLNCTIKNLQHTIVDLRKTIANLEALLKERDKSLSTVKSQMRGVKSTFLPKQSERQLPKPIEKTEEEKAIEQQRKSAERKSRGNNGAKRKEYFELETKEEYVYPGDVDKDDCTIIGSHDVIRYEMQPMKFIKHIYHVLAVKKDEKIYSGKAPITPILNSNYDGSFIAGIAELRYLYSMPVERIYKYFQGHGFDIDKQTAHGLLAKTAGIFENLYKATQQAVKESKYLNCDETYHTVLLKSGNETERTSKKGYIWTITAKSSGLVYFFYDDGSRSENVILKELNNYEGLIQSDGLGAYKKVALQSSGKIKRAACLQHCKRLFLEDDLKNIPEAQEIASLANLLYHYEHQHKIGKDNWTTEDNLKWRQEYAPPILKTLKQKLKDIKNNENKYPPKSLMYKAANYFLNEWDGIELIAHYGDVDWDNNRLEKIQRYISLSRHNSLFFGSHEGAKRGCFYYSLACSCRLNKVSFFEYLSDVLNRAAMLPPGSSIDKYRELLPDKWEKQD